MGQTIAEALREEGKLEGMLKGKLEGMIESRQQMLLLQLQKKFGKQLTNRMTKKIQSTHDIDRLNAWMSNFAVATTLDDVGLVG